MDKPSEPEGVPFNIQERTFAFGVQVIALASKVPRTVAGIEIARQLIRAGTSVGSYMEEAGEGLSKRDFLNHVKIARKEAKELRYWVAMIRAAGLLGDPKVDVLRGEAAELVRILTSIIKRASP